MSPRLLEARVSAPMGEYAARRDTGTVRLGLARPSHCGSTYGTPDDPYFVASVTKLFTTAAVM